MKIVRPKGFALTPEARETWLKENNVQLSDDYDEVDHDELLKSVNMKIFRAKVVSERKHLYSEFPVLKADQLFSCFQYDILDIDQIQTEFKYKNADLSSVPLDHWRIGKNGKTLLVGTSFEDVRCNVEISLNEQKHELEREEPDWKIDFLFTCKYEIKKDQLVPLLESSGHFLDLIIDGIWVQIKENIEMEKADATSNNEVDVQDNHSAIPQMFSYQDHLKEQVGKNILQLLQGLPSGNCEYYDQQNGSNVYYKDEHSNNSSRGGRIQRNDPRRTSFKPQPFENRRQFYTDHHRNSYYAPPFRNGNWQYGYQQPYVNADRRSQNNRNHVNKHGIDKNWRDKEPEK